MLPRNLPRVRADTVQAWRAYAQLMDARAADPVRAAQYVAASGGKDPRPLAAECHRSAGLLAAAEMWWVSADMTDVALEASRDLPEWSVEQAIPSEIGLLIWDRAMPTMEWVGRPDAGPERVPVDGVLWRRAGLAVEVQLLTLTSRIIDHVYGPWRAGPLFMFAALGTPTGDGGPVPGVDLLSARGTPAGDGESLISALGATWLLMSQPTVADTRREPTPPDHARRVTRAGANPADVSVINLRRVQADRDSDDGEDGARWHLKRRHLVRGHWRQQAVGPNRAERRPTWIPPHVKGPDGAPLIAREQVRVWRR